MSKKDTQANGQENAVITDYIPDEQLPLITPPDETAANAADKQGASYVGFRVRVTPETMEALTGLTDKLGIDRNEVIELGIALVSNARRDDLAYFLKRVFEARLAAILQNLP